MTDSMIIYKTTFESTKNLPMAIALGHGENADLIAGITDNGVEVDLTDFTVRAIYQPKSKWGTDDWYECPCEKSNNTIITHWGNLYDNGDNAVILWIYCMKDGELAYPALYKIRLFETPGFAPNPITPIPETLDFSQYTLVNAPWVLQSDFNALSGNVSTLSGSVSTLSGNVSTLTGTVSNLSTRIDTVSSNIPYKFESATGYDSDTQLASRVVYGVSTVSDFSLTLPSMIVSQGGYTTYIIDLIVDVANLNQASGDPESTITFTPIVGKDVFGEDEFEFAVDEGESFVDLMKVEAGKMARFYFTQTGLYHNGKFLIHVSKKGIEAVNP